MKNYDLSLTQPIYSRHLPSCVQKCDAVMIKLRARKKTSNFWSHLFLHTIILFKFLITEGVLCFHLCSVCQLYIVMIYYEHKSYIIPYITNDRKTIENHHGNYNKLLQKPSKNNPVGRYFLPLHADSRPVRSLARYIENA